MPGEIKSSVTASFASGRGVSYEGGGACVGGDWVGKSVGKNMESELPVKEGSHCPPP